MPYKRCPFKPVSRFNRQSLKWERPLAREPASSRMETKAGLFPLRFDQRSMILALRPCVCSSLPRIKAHSAGLQEQDTRFRFADFSAQDQSCRVRLSSLLESLRRRTFSAPWSAKDRSSAKQEDR